MRRILIYGDVDLNVIDGSSVWLTNLAKLLSMEEDVMVDVLLKKRIRRDVLVRQLQKEYRVRLLYAKDYVDSITEVDAHNVARMIRRVDALAEYSCIIVRGMAVTRKLLKEPFVDRLVPYLTDFCHDEHKIEAQEKDFLSRLYERVQLFLVQTDAMKNYLMRLLQVDGGKFHILYPIVFPFPKQERLPKSLIYAGKIARDWKISELLDMMEQLYAIDPSITLHFVGDKFNLDMADRREEILCRLNEMPNVRFYGSLSREELQQVMSRCEVGYAYRSARIDHDGSLEVSVKLLEYCQAQIPMVLRRTAMHEEILGTEYPLFANSEQECLEKLIDVFTNDRAEELRGYLQKCSERFSWTAIARGLRTALSRYPARKARLLVSGHDLKFLKPLFPYMRQEYTLLVQEQEEYTDFSVKQAKQLRNQADIIWCEWLLTAAEWYSKNCYPHQRLFVRAHRFEAMRRFGRQLNVIRLDALICVSYYWMEEFMRRFQLPIEKVCVINNFIDTEAYHHPKAEDAQFHLALIGALPKRKGLKRAIELLHLLKQQDSRYCLHVPGKRPQEFANTWNVEEERRYYEQADALVKEYGLEDSVIYDGWVDVPQFLGQIGYVLSLSDAKIPESFHVTPFEGLASHAMALCLPWEGIEYLYPPRCILDSLPAMAQRILHYQEHPQDYAADVEAGHRFVKEHYDIHLIWQTIDDLLKRGRTR